MLEVLIDKATGDIVVAKVAPANWSDLELDGPHLKVVKLDPRALPVADAVELDLLLQATKGEPYPVVSYPFAEHEVDQKTGTRRMTRISSHRVKNLIGLVGNTIRAGDLKVMAISKVVLQ